MSTLASGVVQDSKTEIYKTGGFSSVKLEKITFANANNQASDETVVLYVKRPGDVSRFLRQWMLSYHDSGDYLGPNETMTLSSGDILEAETTTADMVDYLITGTVQ